MLAKVTRIGLAGSLIYRCAAVPIRANAGFLAGRAAGPTYRHIDNVLSVSRFSPGIIVFTGFLPEKMQLNLRIPKSCLSLPTD